MRKFNVNERVICKGTNEEAIIVKIIDNDLYLIRFDDGEEVEVSGELIKYYENI